MSFVTVHRIAQFCDAPAGNRLILVEAIHSQKHSVVFTNDFIGRAAASETLAYLLRADHFFLDASECRHSCAEGVE